MAEVAAAASSYRLKHYGFYDGSLETHRPNIRLAVELGVSHSSAKSPDTANNF